MSKKDIYKLSESKQPHALFHKQRKHPFASIWLWLLLVLAAAVVLNYLDIINIWKPISSLLGQIQG